MADILPSNYEQRRREGKHCWWHPTLNPEAYACCFCGQEWSGKEAEGKCFGPDGIVHQILAHFKIGPYGQGTEN